MQLIDLKETYLLRWRFDFSDKPTRYGVWNSSIEPAWSVNKNNLVRASIEGKDMQTRETRIIAECDGWDFVNFEWVAATPIHIGLIQKFKNVKFIGSICGLSLVTRDSKITCMVDGKSELRVRTEEEKKQNLAGFGR